jgi:hypothetical protein
MIYHISLMLVKIKRSKFFQCLNRFRRTGNDRDICDIMKTRQGFRKEARMCRYAKLYAARNENVKLY